MKPDVNDFYDIGVPNGNMDLLDAELKARAEAYAAHAHTGEDGTVRVNAMDADTVDGMHAGEFAAIQSVGGSLAAMADYIVEQGVSGIWTYRKWASGIIECWGQTDIGAVGITNTTGNQYYSDTQYLDYPSLANQVDHVSLSAYSDVTVYTLSEYWLANSKIAYRLMTGYQVTTPDVDTSIGLCDGEVAECVTFQASKNTGRTMGIRRMWSCCITGPI